MKNYHHAEYNIEEVEVYQIDNLVHIRLECKHKLKDEYLKATTTFKPQTFKELFDEYCVTARIKTVELFVHNYFYHYQDKFGNIK